MSRKVNIIVAILILKNICIVNCATTDRNNDTIIIMQERNCDLVLPFFQMENITLDTSDKTYGSLCGGKCCSTSMETTLRHHVQRDFSLLLRHNSRSLQGLLDTTASTLQNHILELLRQSENKTATILTQIYRSKASLSQEPMRILYLEARKYVQFNDSKNTRETYTADIHTSVIKFFAELFPLVHHHNLDNRDFSQMYKKCLKERMFEIQPFGDIPRQIAQSLSKSLEATKLLLQSFTVGAEVLNTTETLLTEEGSGKECNEALLKMTYCPKCLGLQKQVKPCSGYCLNVLRGCLTSHITELDSPWNGYVEAIERLVIAIKQPKNEAGVNADNVIRALETRIGAAIMYAMENKEELDKTVKNSCGAPRFVDSTDFSTNKLIVETTSGNKLSKTQRLNVNLRDTPTPETQYLHFLTSIAKSKSFYANLADNLCKDDSFAESKDQNCWNGLRIGEYTKTVVDASITMQKYNPEIKYNAEIHNTDERITNLAEKLRHVHSLVISALGTVNILESDNFMQGDAAEGSGSGYGNFKPYDDDEDRDLTGSGSGDGQRGGLPEDKIQPHKPDNTIRNDSTGGSQPLMLSSSLVFVVTLCLRIFI